MKKAELFAAAAKIGHQHGNMAAGWYFDRSDAGREDFLKVLKGIDDGDQAILDTFQSSPLSGEYADDMNPQRLYEEIEAKPWQIEHYGDELCEAYERCYYDSYETSVVNECLEQLRRNVIFHVEVELDRQDEHKLLSDIEELLAKANASLLESNVSEEGELVY